MYQKNLENLEKYKPSLYQKLMELDKEQLDKKTEKIENMPARDGNLITAVTKDGKQVRLNSAFRPIEEAHKWVQQYKFDNMNKNQYVSFVNGICDKENMKVDNKVINQLSIITNGDIKCTLNYLTALKGIGDNIDNEMFESIFGIPSSVSINKIINGIIECNEELVLNECDKLIKEKFDCNEIMIKLFNGIIEEDIDEDDKHKLLEKLGKKIYKFNKYQESNDKLKVYVKSLLDLFK